MHDRTSSQTMPEPVTRRPSNDEAETRPGGLAGIARIAGAAAALVLVALGWLSLALSALTPIVAPPERMANALDDDAHCVEAPAAAGTMVSDFVGENARTANRTSTTCFGRRAKR